MNVAGVTNHFMIDCSLRWNPYLARSQYWMFFHCNFLPYLLRQNLSLGLELTDCNGVDYPWNLLVRAGTFAHTRLSRRCLCNQNFTDRVISSVSLPSPQVRFTLHCSSFTRNMSYMTVYDANLDLYFYGDQDEWGRLRLLRVKMANLRGPVRQKSQTFTIASTTL